MAPRHRARTTSLAIPGHAQGFIFGIYPGGLEPSAPVAESGKEICDDWTSSPPYPDNNLSLSKYTVVPIRLNGTAPYDWPWLYVYTNWNPYNRSHYVYCPDTSATPWNYLVTKGLANINPNKPLLDAPLFLFELREFPSMLRDLGHVLSRRLHPRDVPNGYLAYSFGWAPLLSDLSNLIDLTKAMNQRLTYLKKARDSGVSMHRSLGKSQSRVSGGEYNLLPNGYGQYGLRSTEVTTTSDKYWMSSRMKITEDLPPPEDIPEFLLRNVLGLNMRPATLWNAIPWSWLVDYLFNIGDMLDATGGQLAWKCTSMCIMHRSEAVSTLENKRSELGLTWNGGDHMTQVTKRRNVYANPTPFFAYRPVLTSGMLANLGALITARALKR